MNEASQLRRRHGELEAAIDRADSPQGSGATSLLVKTIRVGTYPTAAKAMYAVVAMDVRCVESEGQAPTRTVAADADHFYALNVGSAIPPVGTEYLIADKIGSLWQMRFDG